MSGCLIALLLALGQSGQSTLGELRLVVADPFGRALPGAVELVSDTNQVRERVETGADGVAIVRRLPFGSYRVAVARDGFAPYAAIVDIRSAVPVEVRVTLALAAVEAHVTVAAAEPLLDLRQATVVQRIGVESLQQRTSALPGRSLPELVNTQPGWLLEANGTLHPRGAEYQTQYVIDGLPLTDNRSPAFAPEIDADEVHALSILTGGYPAEYGRKLGGVIEVVTAGDARRGLHGGVDASIGSFGTIGGNAVGEYGWSRGTLSVTAGVAGTDRYLDPPVEENFTNHGTTSHVAVHAERDLTNVDRVGLVMRRGDARFLVPNERLQEEAGQRQDRANRETAAQFSYRHLFAAPIVIDLRGMARNVSDALWSNAAATPIAVEQDRGLRELYVKGTIGGHVGRHEWKTGGDSSAGTVRERFGYQLTDPGAFDAGTPLKFRFEDRAADREQALFVQDQLSAGPWTVNAGVRWDRYRLVVAEHAVSPRVGVAWSWPRADLVVRTSYDRAFQTPAFENLLLASSPAVDALGDRVLRLPVQPSRGHFFEAGVSKAIAGVARVDATYFDRHMTHFADDEVLLNTGVSFPIAFRRAAIRGAELKLDVRHWKAASGSISYAWMRGLGELPITGGLFLGDEGRLIASADRFPVSQDQRHTIRGRASYRVTPAISVALAAAYNSGLPFEFDGDHDQALDQYGDRIVDRVDFEAGRVRPALSLDGSASVTLARSGARAIRLQADVRNLTNRLIVINFAGLFSGTALAAPRSVAVRLRTDF